MLAGRKAKYAGIRVGIAVSSSGGLDGDGTPTSQYSASAVSASIFNSVLLDPGITLELYSSSELDETGYSLSIPLLGISASTATTGYQDEAETYIKLVSPALYENFTSPWYFPIASVEWYIGGSLYATYSTGALNATGLAPCYVPLFGLPLALNASVAPGVTGIPFPTNSSYDVTQNATVVFSQEWLELGASEWQPVPVVHLPATLPDCFDSCDLCYDVAGIITGANTGEVTLSIFSTFGGDIQGFGGEYFSRERQIHQTGHTYMVPMLDKTIQKLGDSYAAVIARAGLPYTKFRGTRTCGPTDPPAEGGPYPTPYFRTEIVEGEVHPSYSYAEGTIRSAWNALEAPLDAITYMPYSAARSYVQTGWIGLGIPDGNPSDPSEYPDPLEGWKQESTGFTFPSKTQSRNKFGDPNPDMLPYLGFDGGEGATPEELGNVQRYWSYVCHPTWSYFDAPGNWPVDGSPASFQDYWGPLGEQMTNEGTRTTRISAHLMDTANTDFIKNKAFAVETSWFGICSFQIDKPTFLNTMKAAGPDRWTLTDCTGLFGADTLTLTPGATKIKAEYDLADWNHPPYLRSQWVQDWILNWEPDNMTSIKFTLVGVDGSKVVLAASPDVPDTYPWPADGLTSKKNVGTHAQDWGVAAVADTGVDLKSSGQSAAAMTNNQRVIAPQLLPARSAAKLVIEIEVEDAGNTVQIDLPLMRKPLASPHVIHESRGFASIVAEDGPLVRAGQSQYYDYIADDPIYPPVVRAPGAQQTFWDWAQWWRNVLYGTSNTDGLAAQIAEFFDFNVEYVQPKHTAYDTTVFVWRGENGPVGVVQNTLQPPPLALFWERDRNEYLDPDGDPCQRVWDFSQEKRYAITTVDLVELIKDPDPNWLASSFAIPGWFLWEHAHVVDNTEDDFRIRYDGVDYVNWRPWHGFVWIWGISTAIGTRPWMLQDERGRLHSSWASEGIAYYRRSNFSAPLPSWAVTTIPDDSGDAVSTAFDIDRRTNRIEMLVGRFDGAHSAWETHSDNNGATWSPMVEFMPNAVHPSTRTGQQDGSRVRCWFEFDSGTEGPGTAKGRSRYFGDAAWSATFTFKDSTGTPISIAENGMSPVEMARDGQRRWTWAPIIDGEDEPSDWYSLDFCRTWKRIT